MVAGSTPPSSPPACKAKGPRWWRYKQWPKAAVSVPGSVQLALAVRIFGFSRLHARLKPANGLTERLAEFGKSFWSEEDQRNGRNDEPVHRLQSTFKHLDSPLRHSFCHSNGQRAVRALARFRFTGVAATDSRETPTRHRGPRWNGEPARMSGRSSAAEGWPSGRWRWS